MATSSVVQRSFAGGELAPDLTARADQQKYVSGLALCRNFQVLRHGGVANRAGFGFIAEVKFPALATRLLKFIFEADDQTYLIEAGDHYFRFFFRDEPVVESPGGPLYEVETPYLAADVRRLRVAQSADVLTITHAKYPIYELQRWDHTDWRLVEVVTEPTLGPPTSPSVVSSTAGTRTYRYQATAALDPTLEESYPSTVLELANILPPTIDAPNIVAIVAPLDGDGNPYPVAEYYWYCDPYGNGLYGFVGTAKELQFKDAGFAPDFTITPPTPRVLFDAPDGYPAVSAYYQQRRLFAATKDQPETTWGSQIGAHKNFSVSTPLQDDDAIEWVIASALLSPVRHLIPLKQLVLLTDTGEWIIRGDSNGVLRPTAINPDQEGYHGANLVPPVVIGNSILYVQSRGTVIRDLQYELEQGGFAGKDLTIFAEHLFTDYALREMDFAELPNSTVWAVRSDGVLLGLTYLRDQEVWGWHRHDTHGGAFEHVAVLPDTPAGEDVLYVVVRRTINGAETRYIERLERRVEAPLDQAFFVDSGLRYDGPPADEFSGLESLEGEVVAVVADGVVVFNGDPAALAAGAYTVTGGAITIPVEASHVAIGLAIRFPEIETLALDVEGSAVRDRKKAVQSLTVIAKATAHGFLAGPDAAHLLPARPEKWEAAGPLKTGLIDLNLTKGFTEDGRILIRVVDPLPVTIAGIIPNLELGG